MLFGSRENERKLFFVSNLIFANESTAFQMFIGFSKHYKL